MNGLMKKMSVTNMTAYHSEHDEQVALVQWFRDNFPEPDYIIFAVPNGGTRGTREAARLKEEGVKAGVSDIIILTHGKTIFLEMKKVNTKASQKQKEFHENLDYLGFINLIGYGASDASEKILKELTKTT